MRILYRRIRVFGLFLYRPRLILPLTANLLCQCLNYCRERQHWVGEWHNVAFSEESWFCYVCTMAVEKYDAGMDSYAILGFMLNVTQNHWSNSLGGYKNMNNTEKSEAKRYKGKYVQLGYSFEIEQRPMLSWSLYCFTN